MKFYIDSPTSVAKVPATRKTIITPIKLMIKPATDRPIPLFTFLAFEIPIALKISPNNHITQPIKGIHPKNNVSNANTKPAVPIPLLLASTT